MLIFLAIVGALLLIAGLGICLLNYYLALHNALRRTRFSPVPLIGTLFMIAGLYLSAPLVSGGDVPRGLIFSVLFFDLSALPALCFLPFALLLQKKRGDAPPPSETSGLRAVFIVLYMLLTGGWVLRGLMVQAASLSLPQG